MSADPERTGGLDRTQRINAVLGGISTQERVLSRGEEITLLVFRDNWGGPGYGTSMTDEWGKPFAAGIVLEAVKQYANSLTGGTLMDLERKLGPLLLKEMKDRVYGREVIVDTQNPNVKFVVTDIGDREGRIMGKTYSLRNTAEKPKRKGVRKVVSDWINSHFPADEIFPGDGLF